MAQVREKVLTYHADLLKTCQVMATLGKPRLRAIFRLFLVVENRVHYPDILLGFATVAVERDFSEPMLVKEPVLYIEGGRNLVFFVFSVPNQFLVITQEGGTLCARASWEPSSPTTLCWMPRATRRKCSR